MQYENNIPIYLQVIRQIKNSIVIGELKPGEKMLSARDLAIKYSINPNTAARIYKELEREEVCFTKRGLGTFVTEDTKKLGTIREEMASQLIRNFVEGMEQLGFEHQEMIEILLHRYDNLVSDKKK